MMHRCEPYCSLIDKERHFLVDTCTLLFKDDGPNSICVDSRTFKRSDCYEHRNSQYYVTITNLNKKSLMTQYITVLCHQYTF